MCVHDFGNKWCDRFCNKSCFIQFEAYPNSSKKNKRIIGKIQWFIIYFDKQLELKINLN